MKKICLLGAFLLLFAAPQAFADHHPPEFDWRDLGKVSAVKSQGNCGLSWIFPVTAALESKILIESNVEIDLSEQHVHVCGRPAGWLWCSGGWYSWTLDFILDEGVVAEEVFPYDPTVEVSCPTDFTGTRYSIDEWNHIQASPESIQAIIYDYGPVVISIQVFEDFYSYDSGVYRHVSGGERGGHGLLLVGYGHEDGDPYLIAKNSWGTFWGEDGFIRIYADDTETFRYEHVFTLGNPISDAICEDGDGDGFGFPGDLSCPGGLALDCDDNNPDIHPAAPELCDGIDNNCDGRADDERDHDGDGYWGCAGDCNDFDRLTFPGAAEQCDGADNDCDGTVPADEADADADGVRICAGDCDDTSAAASPNIPEVLDGFDNNCDGAVDEGFDDDGDGIPNFNDLCDDTPPGFGVGPDGCAVCRIGVPEKCDLDRDFDIDRDDINVIFGLRGTYSPPSDPLADLDDNGIININDARGCVLRCTLPGCAVQ